jgi:CcmD family protein
MENAVYLLAAYTIIWAVVFGCLLMMQRKQRSLRRQVALLQESLDKLLSSSTINNKEKA